MASYFEDLTKAFDIALKSFGTANSLPVALENIDAPTSTATPYLASFMLLAVEAGLATCPQECWAMYPRTVTGFLGTDRKSVV